MGQAGVHHNRRFDRLLSNIYLSIIRSLLWLLVFTATVQQYSVAYRYRNSGPYISSRTRCVLVL